MISFEDEHALLKAHVYGEFTLADFREFETAVTAELEEAPRIRLLLDLSAMSGFTIDMAWEEIKFTRGHTHDFRRIAVVASDSWTAWLGWLGAAFTDAEVLLFDNLTEAEGWLTQD